MGKLLRKPRAPKPLPPLTATPDTRTGKDKINDYFESMDFDDEIARVRDATLRQSPTPSVVPSLVSPPPPSESNPRRSLYGRTVTYQSPTLQSRVSFISREEKKFILDPLFRDQTSLGTYVDGKSLIKPYKPRGPEGLPARPPKKNPEIMHAIDITDDIRYYTPPAFTLQNFMVHLSDIRNLPLRKVKELVYSKHNYKKLTKLLAEEMIYPANQDAVHVNHLTPEGQAIPPAEPRIPQKQLLIEMAAMIKQHVRTLMNTEVKSVIKPLPKYSPSNPVGAAPHTEIILVEDDTIEISSQVQQFKQETEMPSKDAVLHTSRTRYFQGAGRSQSPFASQDDGVITPSELAILDSLIQGGTALSLKAHFISELPDISPLAKKIVYLNLSFNDFTVFPLEVLNLQQLEILKLRNNPLRDLPNDIHRLKNLRTLVASFCMIESLPLALFSLEKLEYLDISYNRISFIQNEIAHLQTLRELNLEGNQLPAMPSGALRLDLDVLNVKNNFMHPLFWQESTKNEPQMKEEEGLYYPLSENKCADQLRGYCEAGLRLCFRIAGFLMRWIILQRLVHLSLRAIHKARLDLQPQKLPGTAQMLLKSKTTCDCCNGTRFGPGLRIIRPVTHLFGIRNLPFLFCACSSECLQNFRKSKETLSEILYGREKVDFS